MSDNDNMVLVLLPGMDGTGILFEPFIRLLPEDVDVRIVRYPEDRYLSYEQLAERAASFIPPEKAYLIIAESYSGPVAALLAAHPVGNLEAVVLVSSFVSRPLGRLGQWLANFVPTSVFRSRAPAWALRWLLMETITPPAMIAAVQDAVARVRPDVLAHRLRDALTVDFSPVLAACTARIICIGAAADRLLATRGVRRCLAAKNDVETVEVAGPHLLLQCAPGACLATLRRLGLLGQPM